jgi:DNA-binding beta-propeller fold protein YncE
LVAVAEAGGGVWILTAAGVQAVDPDTGEVGTSGGAFDPDLCWEWKDMVVAFSSAWVACGEGRVVRIDVATGAATTIDTAVGAHTLAVTDGAVWVTNYRSDSISRIRADTNEVVTTPGAGKGVGITSGGGFIWASTYSGIAKVDPTTASIVDEVELDEGEYYELVWDRGTIWASTRGPRVLHIDPEA